jgi:hypothetical protein
MQICDKAKPCARLTRAMVSACWLAFNTEA